MMGSFKEIAINSVGAAKNVGDQDGPAGVYFVSVNLGIPLFELRPALAIPG